MIMSLFKTQTKKVNHTSSSSKNNNKAKKTKRSKSSMKGGMIRDGTVVQNMPKRS